MWACNVEMSKSRQMFQMRWSCPSQRRSFLNVLFVLWGQNVTHCQHHSVFVDAFKATVCLIVSPPQQGDKTYFTQHANQRVGTVFLLDNKPLVLHLFLLLFFLCSFYSWLLSHLLFSYLSFSSLSSFRSRWLWSSDHAASSLSPRPTRP